MKRIIKGKSPRLERQLDRCNKLLLSMKRECGDWQLLEDVTGLAAGIMTAFSYMETFMEESRSSRNGRRCWTFISASGIFKRL